jgi:hypothetical protein
MKITGIKPKAIILRGNIKVAKIDISKRIQKKKQMIKKA